MARYKKYFPVSHDFNHDPDIKDIKAKHGDKAVFLWLEILSILDRHDNTITMDTRTLDSLSKASGKRPGKCLLAVNYFVDKHLLTINKPLTNGFIMTYSSPNYMKYHRTRGPIGGQLGANWGPIGGQFENDTLPFSSPPHLKNLSLKDLKSLSLKDLKDLNDLKERKEKKGELFFKEKKEGLGEKEEEPLLSFEEPFVLTAETKADKLTPPDFWEAIKQNHAYKEIDIDREVGKMEAWFLTPKGRGRKLTKAFVVHWLNGIDVSISGVNLRQKAIEEFLANDQA